jgi:hypothetical protein
MSTPNVIAVIAVAVMMTSSLTPSFVLSVVDAARVLSQPEDIYLTRAVAGRLNCPADANPPVTHVAWTKDGRPLQVARRLVDSDPSLQPKSSVASAAGTGAAARVTVADDGALLFTTVTLEDAGRYACTPHSSLGIGQSSVPVQVLVKGTPLDTRAAH